MKILGIALGLAVGILTAFLLTIPMIELFTCDSFWEQGCGPYHSLRLIGALTAAGIGGLFAGWGAADLFTKLVAKLQRP